MSFLGGIGQANPNAGRGGAEQGHFNEAYGQTQDQYNSQQALLRYIQSQNTGAFQGQNQLAGQLQQQAAGQGPNPAQAMLAQQTSNNVAQQNALMAGQRGASANAGLLARQSAMQGANIQQNANLQAAQMQAQQQLAAQHQLQQLYGTQSQQLMGQSAANQQAALQNQQQMLGSLGQQGANTANIAAGNAKTQGGMFGGMMNAAGPALQYGMSAFGKGGIFGAGGGAETALITGEGAMLPAVGGFMEGAGSAVGTVLETAGPVATVIAAHGGEIPSPIWMHK